MEYGLTARELHEAEVDFAAWLHETGNNPQAVFDELLCQGDMYPVSEEA